MAESSPAEAVVKLGLGIGVGFGLYYLIRNLGFGGGGGRGAARDEGAALPSPPLMPRDEQRLEFVMVGPTTLNDKTAAFRGPGGKIYALEEMIARIKAGGRADMVLKVRGDVISGPSSDAEAQIKKAGIAIWKSEPVKTVAGNARGQYGDAGCVGRSYNRGYEQ